MHGRQDDAFIGDHGVPALCNSGTVALILGTAFGDTRRAHHNGRRRVRRRENHWQAEVDNKLDPAVVRSTMIFFVLPFIRMGSHRKLAQ